MHYIYKYTYQVNYSMSTKNTNIQRQYNQFLHSYVKKPYNLVVGC